MNLLRNFLAAASLLAATAAPGSAAVDPTDPAINHPAFIVIAGNLTPYVGFNVAKKEIWLFGWVDANVPEPSDGYWGLLTTSAAGWTRYKAPADKILRVQFENWTEGVDWTSPGWIRSGVIPFDLVIPADWTFIYPGANLVLWQARTGLQRRMTYDASIQSVRDYVSTQPPEPPPAAKIGGSSGTHSVSGGKR